MSNTMVLVNTTDKTNLDTTMDIALIHIITMIVLIAIVVTITVIAMTNLITLIVMSATIALVHAILSQQAPK